MLYSVVEDALHTFVPEVSSLDAVAAEMVDSPSSTVRMAEFTKDEVGKTLSMRSK